MQVALSQTSNIVMVFLQKAFSYRDSKAMDEKSVLFCFILNKRERGKLFLNILSKFVF